MFSIENKEINTNLVEFQFCKFPKIFFEKPEYRKLSDGAKVLYCALYDRNSLSTINGWNDKNGNIFIYYSNKSLCETLNCSHDTVTKRLKELEQVGLIQRHKQKLGRPDMIYVYPPSIPCELPAPQNADNKDYTTPVTSAADSDFVAPIKTNQNNTDYSDTNPSINQDEEDKIRDTIKVQIGYAYMDKEYIDMDQVDEIITLMMDIHYSKQSTVNINGSPYPKEYVIRRFESLKKEHIMYVVNIIKETTTEIRNMRSYMLTALFNARTTMNNYLVQRTVHDMPQLAMVNALVPKEEE